MKKNPWIAAILNLLFAGAGYLYLGKRGLFGGMLLAGVLVAYYWSFTDPLAETLFSNALFMIAEGLFAVALAVDAYQEAKK